MKIRLNLLKLNAKLLMSRQREWQHYQAEPEFSHSDGKWKLLI